MSYRVSILGAFGPRDSSIGAAPIFVNDLRKEIEADSVIYSDNGIKVLVKEAETFYPYWRVLQVERS